MTPKYSVVVPIYNEEETIPELYNRLDQAMSSLSENYEIIFVNDGSKDNSINIIKEYASKNKSIKALDFSRNFGAQPAYSAGIEYATGDAVIVIDGDLQDPPELIPKLVEKWKEGYDVVYAVKARRKENPIKKIALAIFYNILASISSVPMPTDAGGFSIMSRRVVDAFKKMPEKNRLVSGIRAWIGFKQTGLVIARDSRYKGESRQTIAKLFNMAIDGFFSFSIIPIRLATIIGVIIIGLAGLSIVILICIRLFTNILVVGWTSLIVTIVLFGGLQLIFIGILGEYIYRIFDEVKNRPLYLIREKIGFDQ